MSSKENLVEEAVHWAASNGLTMLVKGPNGAIDGIQHCPMTLEPFVVPVTAFNQGVSYALAFNEMVDSISRDTSFMYNALKGVEASDEFTAQLLRISKAVNSREGGLRQKVALGIHRSDYMLNKTDGNMLQVELNTIASSFGALSTRISKLHRFLKDRFGQKAEYTLPNNNITSNLAQALATAHSTYASATKRVHDSCQNNNVDVSKTIVIFVVQHGETNISDQRPIEYALFENHDVPAVRLTFADIYARTALAADGSGRLILDGIYEVSVVYFRAGYTPNDYIDGNDWDARQRLEESLAIKCPSIDYQLVGTKKIQQVLTNPKILRRFCSEKTTELLSKCMAGIWALGNSADVDDAARAEIAKAIENPGNYVVKPQREGGGNNFYGDDVARVLKEMSDSELSAYILMQRIFPGTAKMILIRNGKASSGDAMCEMGVYAPYLGDGKRTFLNDIAGYLVRTKFVGVDEGGVASGYACLSSLALDNK
jgi:glutathione synthase